MYTGRQTRDSADVIHILLPVHNRRTTSEAFARALVRQGIACRLLLIDDGSTDGTAESVSTVLPSCTTLLRGTGTWWWGGSLHQGWLWLGKQALSDDDIVLICNDDVDIPDDFISRGIELLSANPRTMVVAKSRKQDGGASEETCFSIDYARCRVALATPGEAVVCAPTRGLFIRWGDMRRVGGFHPRLIPHYLSDLEWTLRGHRQGLTILRDDRLWLTQHAEKTGFHGMGNLGFGGRLKRLLSTKYAGNPIHWSAFVLLGFPPRYWLPALARIGLWTIGGLLGRTPRS